MHPRPAHDKTSHPSAVCIMMDRLRSKVYSASILTLRRQQQPSLLMLTTIISRFLAAVLILAAITPASGQDFVGRLAFAIEPQTAKDVGLSDTEVAKLKEFIDVRLKEAN